MFSKRFFATVVSAFLLAVVVLAWQVFSVQAAPAAPTDIPVTQPDGKQLVLRQWGDEWQHGMETPDGYTVIQNADGYWVYAADDASGGLRPARGGSGPLVVGQNAPGSLRKHLRPAPVTPPAGHVANRAPNSGTQALLLILVDFSNTPHIYDASVFQTSFFGASNSITDFYKKASFNALTIGKANETHGTANDGVVGWLRLPGTFTTNTDWTQLAADAMTAANPYVNYAAYDANSDGDVSSSELHVIIVVSGYEQSYCGPSCLGVWAHRGSFSGLTLDGKTREGYAMFGEIHGTGSSDPNKHTATIGVMAHELGHDLSWPDLYDANGSTNGQWEGVGEWSIMGSGSWNYVSGVTNAGGTPAMPDAWSKAYQGWLTPTVASAGNSYNLTTAATNAYALQLGANPGGIDWDFYVQSGTGEYWLVENRQLTGYDAGLPGCGILIWHIDETVTSSNYANGNPSKPLVAVEEADGLANLFHADNRGDTGDPYPGSTNNLSFGNSTNPNSRFHDGSFSGHTVSVVTTSCAATMAVQYTNETILLDNHLYLPLSMAVAPPKVASGKVTVKGVAASGVKISLDYTSDDWSTYDTITTTTNSSGNYSFGDVTPQELDDLNQYMVYYDNPSTTYNSRLAWWNCTLRTTTTGSEVCNMDIADVTHKGPAAGANVNLPYTFTWNRRATTSDSYELDFMDGDGYYACWTYKLGYVSSFQMTSLSTNLICNQTMYSGAPYYRWMWLYGPSGYGTSWYVWLVTINGPAGPELNVPAQMVPAKQILSRSEFMRRIPKVHAVQ